MLKGFAGYPSQILVPLHGILVKRDDFLEDLFAIFVFLNIANKIMW